MASEKFTFFSAPKTMSKIQDLAGGFILYCRSQEERITQKTAQITVIILLLNPSWRHIIKGDSKEENQNFFETCFNFLFDENNISSKTIKMQAFFLGRYLSREQFKDYQKQIIGKNCTSLLQKLKKVWHNTTEDFKEMHNDLIKLILIKEGMGDKDDYTAFDEMKTAINSVFPLSALSTFVLSNHKTKMAYISEVSSIAVGIRLHAWYSNKAGRFMIDVGKIMKETIPKICEDLHEELSKLNEKVKNLQKQLEQKVLTEVPSGDIDFYHEKILLISLTNYSKYIKALKDAIDEVCVQTYKSDYMFTMQIKELNSALKTGPFVTADRVYPLYKEVAQTWKHIQLEGHLLDFYINLYQEMKKFSVLVKGAHANKTTEVPQLENEIRPKEDEESVILILPEDVKNFSTITLEYQEFCAYYSSLGVLLPSNRDVGIVTFRNLCYGFSSKEAMEFFQKEPNKCIESTLNYMLVMPELIITLGMEDYFNLPVTNVFKCSRNLPVFISESSVQTVLHPVEENIDYTYNWNQWGMRKQAVKYADIINKKTHSTQTDLSHFRRENYSQVYLPKDNWTQTKKDASTTMAKGGIPELYLRTRTAFFSKFMWKSEL